MPQRQHFSPSHLKEEGNPRKQYIWGKAWRRCVAAGIARGEEREPILPPARMGRSRRRRRKERKEIAWEDLLSHIFFPADRSQAGWVSKKEKRKRIKAFPSFPSRLHFSLPVENYASFFLLTAVINGSGFLLLCFSFFP